MTDQKTAGASLTVIRNSLQEQQPLPCVTRYGTPTVTQKELAIILGRLAAHFPSRNLSAKQAEYVVADWFSDVKHFPAATLEAACTKWRRDPENKWFPTPGQLIALCNRIPDPGFKRPPPNE